MDLREKRIQALMQQGSSRQDAIDTIEWLDADNARQRQHPDWRLTDEDRAMRGDH